MKQENGKKKSKLWLWLVIAAVALLAVAGVVLALVLGGGQGDTGPKGGRAELYWNIDKKAYTENSESGLSTREPGEDGVFRVRFAYNGEIVEYAVADKQLINYIDTMDVMGLVKDSDGTVVDVINPKDIAKEVNKNAYVKSATANKIVANTSVAMNGMNINVKLEEGITEIYDVTPEAEVPGQKITTADLKAMDTLVIYANDLDQVTHVYVNSHSKESKVYWRADQSYDSTNKTTTREPDENGAYTIPFFCEGEVVELKTKDKAIATKIDSISRWKCHFGFTFDEEGYIIEQYASAIGIQGIMVADCWDVVEIDGDTYTIQRLTTNDGSVWTGTIPEGTIIYEAGVKAKREGRGGQQIDSLQMGDRVTVWTNTTGEVVLVYVAERLVDSPAYWSPTRKYKTADKTTTREIGPSGYYEIELYKEGTNKKEVYYVKDKETMSYMDSLTSKIMALKVLPGNIVEYAYSEETISGYTMATRGGVVTTVTGGIFTKMTYGKPGTESNMVLAANARVWNVSGYGNYGEATTVQPGDHIYGLRQPTGEILVAFITKRTIGGEKLYWNLEMMWDKTNKTSTRVPDADGWYHFTMAHQGKQVELKTKNKELVDKIDGLSIGATALDVSGGVIYNVYDAAYPYGGNKVASGYKFQYVTSEGKYFCTYASDANKTVEFKMAEDCVIYNVSPMFSSHKGERIYSIPQGAMLTCFADIKGEVKVVYVRSQQATTMYWKTNILYDSTNKVTKRIPDADGYYWYDLAVDGECKTFKTKDQKIANSMDSYAGAFGLNVRGDEIFGFISTSSVKGVSGNGFTTAIVTAVNGRTITVEVSGKTETMKLTSDCKIYDVSPVAKNFGEKSEIKVGDIVRTYLNEDKSAHSYVYIKSRPARVKGEVGYCEHCQKEVSWKPMDGNSAPSVSTSTHWYVPANMTAWVQASFVNTAKDYEICIDLNGKILTRSENGRMFRVAEGETLNLMDSVGGGKIVAGGGNNYSGSIFLMSAGGVVNMYGGTIEYVDNGYKPATGIVHMSGSETVFNLYNGVVTGGKAYAQPNEDAASAKHATGGNFYLAGGATLNMYDGEISNGTVYGALNAAIKNGSKVYNETTYSALTGYGGNIYMTESSDVYIFGGVVKDGQAIRETFTAPNGTEFTNMTYGGNIYKVNTNKLDGTLYIENATVSGGKAHRGGNINAYAGSSGGSAGIVVLNNAKIIDGEASQFGGNIMSNAAQWGIIDSVISGGTATTGGNIYSQGGVYAVVTGSTIKDGEAGSGGNIYLYKNKVEENIFVVGEGTVIENGTATTGGNINLGKKNYVKLSDGKVVDPKEDDGTGEPLLPVLIVAGGEIKGGNADLGENIYCAGHMNVAGGTVTDGDIYFVGNKEAVLFVNGGEINDKFTVKSPAEFDIEGAPKIKNLAFDKKVKATVGEMTEGACVKVSTAMGSPVFTTAFNNAQAYADAGYFTGTVEGVDVYVTAENELAIEAVLETDLRYCEHCKQEVEFVEWTYANGDNVLENGHFFLTKNESISSNFRIGDKNTKNLDVVVDLNGYNVTSTSSAFYVYPSNTLSIQDSEDTSVVTGEGIIRNSKPGDGGVIYLENGNLNVYGGTFTLKESEKVNNGGVIFGGTNIKIYGGTFNGNKVAGNGTAICTGGNLELNGGTITGEVYGRATAVVSVSGAPVVEKLQVLTGNKITIGELTEGASIAIEAEGICSKANANTAAYVAAGYIKSATSDEVKVTTSGELRIGEVEGLLTYYCPVCERDVDWMPYDGVNNSIIKGDNAHYYIEEGGHYQSYGQISIQGEVTLDLHGETLTGKGRDGDDCKRLWRVEGVFNILDTVGGGKAIAYGLENNGGAMIMTRKNPDTGDLAVINLYSGILTMTEDCKAGSSGGIISIAGGTIMNMYGGEIYGGKATREHAQNIYIGDGTLNMMGGFIDGGIEVSTSAVAVNLSGAAKISNNNGGLWIAKDKLIGLDAFESAAEIYVSVDETAFITEALNNANDFLAYVKPALTGWTVENRNGALIVTDGNEPAEPFDPNKVYEKAAAMDFSNADDAGKVMAKCPVCEEKVEWNVLPANTSGASLTTLESGHYYLSEDVDYTHNNGLYSFTKKYACINLNGQTLVSTVRAFHAESSGSYLNFMGEGSVTGKGYFSSGKGFGAIDAPTVANFYGGTYISSGDGPAIGNRKTSTGEAVTSIYNGTTVINENGVAVYVLTNGSLEINGGTINGKVTDANSKGITVSGAPVINALDLTNGAKIMVGELTSGAKITVLASGVFTDAFDNAQAYLDAEYFVSGVEDTTIAVEGNALAVTAAEADPNAVYEAAKAMDFTAGGTVTAQCPACGVDHDWVALPAPGGTSKAQLPAGAYYVAEDMEIEKFWYIADKTAGKICINLNGKNITNTTDRVFYAENKANTLNIMGDGIVTGAAKWPNAKNTNYVGVLDVCTTVNLYGGTWRSSTQYPIIANRGSGAHSTVSIFGGTEIIRTAEDVAGLNVYISDAAIVNMYAGIVSGGTAIEHPALNVGKVGGNVQLKANISTDNYAYTCSFNLYGGVVENGTSEGKGGNIAAVGNDLSKPKAMVNLCGGTVANGGVIAIGANASVTVSGDAVVDFIETEGANLINVGELEEGADIVVAAQESVVFTNTVTGDVAKYFRGNTNRMVGYTLNDAVAIANICPHCGKTFAEIEWTEIGEIGENYKFTVSGHYKLTQDVTNTKSNIFTFNEATKGNGIDVVLDTCGFKVTSVGRGIYINKYNTMTVFDSVGGTEITSISKTEALGGSGVYVHEGAILNFYDITVVGSPNAHGNGNALSVYGSKAIVNIYSGEFYGNDDVDKAEKRGGVVFNRAGTLNIYGGYFDSVELASDGVGNCICNDSTMNIYGGEFAGEIYTKAGATTTVADDMDITDLLVNG